MRVFNNIDDAMAHIQGGPSRGAPGQSRSPGSLFAIAIVVGVIVLGTLIFG